MHCHSGNYKKLLLQQLNLSWFLYETLEKTRINKEEKLPKSKERSDAISFQEFGITKLSTSEIKGLFEATTLLHDEVHASVYVEKMKIFWLCCKNNFFFFCPLFKPLKITL